MEPYAKQAYNTGVKPYMEEKIGYDEAFSEAVKPFKTFRMYRQNEKPASRFLKGLIQILCVHTGKRDTPSRL
jgi:flagellar biosynthetic protein FliP